MLLIRRVRKGDVEISFYLLHTRDKSIYVLHPFPYFSIYDFNKNVYKFGILILSMFAATVMPKA